MDTVTMYFYANTFRFFLLSCDHASADVLKNSMCLCQP